ncbi:hypothetical protein DITRI_Ditri15bG0102300 [Diplodiscus trichospermus]
MKIGTWNIRGLGRGEKKRAVKKLVSKGKLNMLFLQETKLKNTSVRLSRWLRGSSFFRGVFVDAEGTAGGLVTCWDENFFEEESRITSNRFILLIGFIKSINLRCGFMNLYAPNDDAERMNFWNELEELLSNVEIPWCLGGDFNVVRSSEEKIGVVYNQTAMSQFSNFIENMGLVDMPLTGGKFTWCNNRASPTFCRLDRFLISPEIFSKFDGLYQMVWPRSISDHWPVLLLMESVNWRPRPFKFFNYWMNLDGYDKMVNEAWVKIQEGSPISANLWSKLKELKVTLREWCKSKGSIEMG